MIQRVFGCRKFKKLVAERNDRELSGQEINFVDRHRSACTACCRSEKQFAAALNMLRSATLEPDAKPMFDERVIRRLRLNRARESVEYWSPAFVGAAIACLGLFAALQMISRTSELPQFSVPKGEAMRLVPQDRFPTLLLNQSRNTNQPR